MHTPAPPHEPPRLTIPIFPEIADITHDFVSGAGQIAHRSGQTPDLPAIDSGQDHFDPEIESSVRGNTPLVDILTVQVYTRPTPRAVSQPDHLE